MKILEIIKKIERETYPYNYQQMQDIDSYAELKDYCEGTPKIVLLKNGYLIMTKIEIVDLASTDPLTLKDLHILLCEIQKYFKTKPFSMDAREKTSYRLIQYLKKRKKLVVLRDNKYNWDSEIFHRVTCKFI